MLIDNGTTIDNLGGGVVDAAGGNVTINGGAVLEGGTLESSGGGEIVEAGYATLDGSTQLVTSLGTVALNNNTSLYLLGTIDNVGTIALNSSGYDTDLVANASTVTLTGGGTIAMSDNGNNRIYGESGSNLLVNLNNTITGSGQIGAGQLTLINDATIDSNGAAGMTIYTGNVVTNNALIEATGSGGLSIVGGTTIANAASTGIVAASGGNVDLNGATIAGGTITSSGGAAVYETGSSTLDGSTQTLTNTGTVVLDNNTSLVLLGSIDNTGTISLQSTGYQTDLIINSPTVTLTGGGTIAMSDNGNNRIYGASGAYELINVDNTITGAGQLGAGQLTLVNDSTIDFTGGSGSTLYTGNAVSNNALIEETGSGGLSITGGTTIANAAATGILAANGGNIYLNGATIAGGTIETSGGAAVYETGSATLDGSAGRVTNLGTIAMDNNTTMLLLGTINNAGTILVNSTGYQTNLIVDSPTVTLTGGGTLAMSDNGNNRLYGASSAYVLNNVSDTIAGAGQLGAGQLTLINGGTIEATGGNALYVNLGSTGTNTTSGAMLGVGSGGLVFQNGIYTNSGLIEAQNGSSVTFQSGATLTNDGSTGILSKGTYEALSTGSGATVALGNSVVKTDSATLIYSGVGATITAGGTSVASTLSTISATGVLDVLNGASFVSPASLTDKGQIVLSAGTLGAKVLTIAAGATITGSGTITAGLHDFGVIVATGGVLTVNGNGTISGLVEGTGTLSLSGHTTTLGSGATLDVSAITMINHANLNLATNIAFAGTFDVVGGETITTSNGSSFTNTGVFEETGSGTSTVSAPFSNSGTILVSSGTLDFTAGLSNAANGVIDDNVGKFNTNAALSAGTLEIGGKAAAASIGGSASTLAVLDMAGGSLNTNGSTVTITGDYDNTAAGKGNAYNPFAGVTGTIDGQGTQLTVVGVNGTTITTVNGTPTITVAPGGKAQFVVENAGAAGSASLRGALQTSVNGGNITSPDLSGNGVTAANFGPIAAGGKSAVYTINYSSGSLSNQAIHFQSDFANVAGVTVDVVGSGGTAAASAGTWNPSAPSVTPDAVVVSHG